MKNILLALICCLPLMVGAQGPIVVSPNPTNLEILNFDPTDQWVEEVADAHVNNMTGDQILMRWELEIIDAPASWEYRVCDQNQCYTIGVLSNWMEGILEEPDTLSALEENSNLQLHVLPRGEGGTGTVHIKLSTIAEPDVVLETAVFNVTATPLVSSVTNLQKQLIQVFPNPTTEYFSLNNAGPVDELIIYNPLGKQVRAFEVYEGKRYFIGDLPDGLYLITMVSKEAGILKTTRISKRSLRP